MAEEQKTTVENCEDKSGCASATGSDASNLESLRLKIKTWRTGYLCHQYKLAKKSGNAAEAEILRAEMKLRT